MDRPAHAVFALLVIGLAAGIGGPGQGLAQPVVGPSTSAAIAQGESGQSIEVRSGDTLSELVIERLPEDIRLNQAMIAVFEANPRAFIARNINLLRADATLRIPDRAVMARVEVAYANRLVRQHEAEFAAYRSRLARRAAAADPIGAPGVPSASGLVQAPSASAGVGAAADQDRLVLSKPAEHSAGSPASPPSVSDPPALAQAAIEARFRTLEEARIAREAALAEATTRINELERNVGELQQLLQLRNQVLSDARDQLEQVRRDAESGKAAVAAQPTAPMQGQVASTDEARTSADESRSPAEEARSPAEEARSAADEARSPADPATPPSAATTSDPASASAGTAAAKPPSQSEDSSTASPVTPVSEAPQAEEPKLSEQAVSPSTVAPADGAPPAVDPASPSVKPALSEQPIFWVSLGVIGLLLIYFVLTRRRPDPLEAGESELARAVGPTIQLPTLDLDALSSTTTASTNPRTEGSNPNSDPPRGGTS